MSTTAGVTSYVTLGLKALFDDDCPVMSPCPSPQKTSQWNGYVPGLAGFTSTRVMTPGFTSTRMPSPGQLKPCWRSSDVSSMIVGRAVLERHLIRHEGELLRDDSDDRGHSVRGVLGTGQSREVRPAP